MRGRSTGFILQSMATSKGLLVTPKRSMSYDPLKGFEPWDPASINSPLNPANPIYQEMFGPKEKTLAFGQSTKKKNKPAPAPVTDEKQQTDFLKLRADY